MIGLTLALALALGALILMSVVMTVSWLVQKKLGNAGWTDVFWTFGTGVCGVVAALWPDPYAHQPRQWLVAVLIAVAATVFPIGKLEEMVNVGTLFAFVLVSAGVIILRRTRPDLKRGFTVPLVPLLPILSIAACAWLMLNLSGLTWIRFGLWMVLGIVIYLGYGRRHSVLGRREAAANR